MTSINQRAMLSKNINEPLLNAQQDPEYEVFEVKCNPDLNFAYKKVPSSQGN